MPKSDLEKQVGWVLEILPEQRTVMRKMFGGRAFMVDGNMCCGIDERGLMVRVGPDAYENALKLKGARKFELTGSPLRGMVHVDLDAVSDKRSMRTWLKRGVDFVSTLPAKPPNQADKKRK